MSPVRLVSLIAVAVVLTSLGCGDGLHLSPVRGKITYKGAPVTDGIVQFYPTSAGPVAVGRLNSSGEFTLTSENPADGAVVGEHTVVVLPAIDMQKAILLKPGQRLKTKFKEIPKLVRDLATSPLTAVVEADSNSFEFDLGEISDN